MLNLQELPLCLFMLSHELNKFPCQLCDYQATQKSHLTQHNNSVHQNIKIQCTMCGHKAAHLGHLKTHIQSQHKEVKKTLCVLCNKEFSGLYNHIKSKHKGVTYNCNICQYKITQNSHLTRHIKTLHFKERKYPCKICDYQATIKSNLSNHVKNVPHRSENTICTECNKSIWKYNLKTHKKLCYSELQILHNCKVCTFKTIHLQSLDNHVKNVHQKNSKT